MSQGVEFLLWGVCVPGIHHNLRQVKVEGFVERPEGFHDAVFPHAVPNLLSPREVLIVVLPGAVAAWRHAGCVQGMSEGTQGFTETEE